MADGGEAFDAYLRALAARCADDPDNLAKVLEFRRALRAGRLQGRAASGPVLHSKGQFHEQSVGLPTSVDIILPVHNALQDVQVCLESVRRAADSHPGQVWLIDDGSAPETAQWLAAQQDGLVRAIRTPENLGFTGAVALGFQQTTAELVVVLNSDAVVDDGWLKALIRPFHEDARVALTGPLSNAAAWQNLGRVTNSEGLFATNLMQPGAEMGEINRFLRRHGTGSFLDLPIVHGFCFAISRAAYDQVGGFDLQNFGAGYGETQDLCFRLRAAGYRIGVCADVFVQHGRSRSYSHVQRTSLSNSARRKLYRKHGALNYLRAEADCIDDAQLNQIRAEAAGWFAQDTLSIQALAEDAPRPAEFAEIVNRSTKRRSGQRIGKSVIGLPRAGAVQLVRLDWSGSHASQKASAVSAEQAIGRPRAPASDPQPTLPFAARWVSTLEPLERIVASWCLDQNKDPGAKAPLHLGAKAIEAAILKSYQRGSTPRVMVSLSHDNYLTNKGGVQFCIQQEEAAARDRSVVYLNLHPSRALPRLAHIAETPDPAVNLVLNGAMIGTSPISEVIRATKALVAADVRIDVVVHHLLGHVPEQVARLVQTSRNPCWFWLHDFFALCPGFTLLRNDLTYCAAPPVSSNACQICLYGEERALHLQRIRVLAATVDLHLISPSDFMTRHFNALGSLPFTGSQITTVPHMDVLWRDLAAGPVSHLEHNSPLKIAFLGNPAYHKGWQAFQMLSQDTRALSHGVRFLHLGAERKQALGVDWQFVQVSAQDPEAMVRALTENAVDFVFHWANWPETFSFTTFEALAAGAWVITRPESGNVAATMAQIEPALIFPDTDALLVALGDGTLAAIAKKLRQKRSTSRRIIRRSAMTFAALEEESVI